MANEVGTANNLEDLFGKIVSFLTTNATLVSNSQQWQILRQRRDNIQSFTHNMVDPSTAGHATALRCCRYDPRQLNTDSESARYANFYSATFTVGVSYLRWELKTARDVTKIRMRAPQSSGDVAYMLRNFRLQYSDNGSTWTTALTINASTTFALGEWRDYNVTSVGAHIYWQIICDSTQTGTSIAFGTMLLLETDETVANQFGSEVIFKAVGNAGSDEIFTGIRSEYSSADGWYNLFLNGFTGYDVNENSWFKQPGCIPDASQATAYRIPMIPCWNTTMPYWFVASGRSFRLAVKISTNFEGGYMGFLLPYATPSQYPYPLAIGGSLAPDSGNRTTAWRYSYVHQMHGVFVGPGIDTWTTFESVYHSSLYVRGNDGAWRWWANRPNSVNTSETIASPTIGSAAPYTPGGAIRTVWPHCVNNLWSSGRLPYRDCLGGGYILQPTIVQQHVPTKLVIGEFEGVYAISGYQNAAENTMTYGGKTVVVFQNAYRNTIHEFWALSLD
mgnify:CR=1